MGYGAEVEGNKIGHCVMELVSKPGEDVLRLDHPSIAFRIGTIALSGELKTLPLNLICLLLITPRCQLIQDQERVSEFWHPVRWVASVPFV